MLGRHYPKLVAADAADAGKSGHCMRVRCIGPLQISTREAVAMTRQADEDVLCMVGALSENDRYDSEPSAVPVFNTWNHNNKCAAEC